MLFDYNGIPSSSISCPLFYIVPAPICVLTIQHIDEFTCGRVLIEQLIPATRLFRNPRP